MIKNDRPKYSRSSSRYAFEKALAYYAKTSSMNSSQVNQLGFTCTNMIYTIVVGKTAKEIRDYFQVPYGKSFRKHLPENIISAIEDIEKLAACLIKQQGMKPLEAIEEASKGFEKLVLDKSNYFESDLLS